MSELQAKPASVTPHPLHQHPAARSRIEGMFKGKTVTMVFPCKVYLQLDDGTGMITFNPGVQEVPEQLVDHWFLAQKGVAIYQKPSPKEEVAAQITESHVKFLQHRGYEISTVAEAQKFYDNLENGELKMAFLMDAGKWELALIEVKVEKTTAAPNEPKEEEEEPASGADVDLTKLTKDQLVLHAAEHHELELDRSAKKEELIAAIEEARSAAGEGQ